MDDLPIEGLVGFKAIERLLPEQSDRVVINARVHGAVAQLEKKGDCQ